MKRTIVLLILFLLVSPSMSLAAGGTWTKKVDMPTARTYMSASVVDGKIYVIGGRNANANLSTTEAYNPTTDTWTRKADMPTARRGVATCAVNGKIYAIGGFVGMSGYTAAVEEYHPATDTWVKKSNMSTGPRAEVGACVVNGKIYVIGGWKFGNSIAIVEEYDPVSDTWTKKSDMPTSRGGLTASAVNGKIYAIGGRSGPFANFVRVDTVEEYDPVADTWTKKKDMPTPRWGLAAVAVNGKIYAISGTTPNGTFTTAVEVYDPATDTWSRIPDLPTARWGLAAAAVKGRIYAIGGGGKNIPDLFANVDVYTPEGWPFSVSPHDKLATTWGRMKANSQK